MDTMNMDMKNVKDISPVCIGGGSDGEMESDNSKVVGEGQGEGGCVSKNVCSYGYIVYGWKEPSKDYYIEKNWVFSRNIHRYTTDQDGSLFFGNIIYGIECLFDEDSGVIYISDSDKLIVQQVFKNVQSFYKTKFDDSVISKLNLGYYIASRKSC